MTAIVTGSDSGIGRATAVALARGGHDVGITYSRDEAGANGTAEEVRSHGRRAEVRHLDLTASDRVQPVIDELADALGGLDVLVNNAGSGSETPFLELEVAEWRDVFEVNLTGAFLAAQAAARRMVAAGRGGRIVNVTSVHEHVPLRGADRPGIPAGRPGDAREVAGLVAYLASPEASYSTGASYVVDGGLLLMAAVANQIAME